MKVLIVDDNTTNLKLLRAILENENIAVVAAGDGIQALSILYRVPVDAIISDILMPHMDGYRLCHEVRHDERLENVPFIFYTATYTSPADEKLCMELGGDKYMRKPASSRQLLEALAEVTSSTRQRPVSAPLETDVLTEYSERLVAKLEQKNIELTQRTEELQAAQQRLAHLLAHTPAVIYTLKIEGQKITPVIVSGNVESVLGVSVAEASVHQWWLESLHPEDRERVLAAVSDGLTKDGFSMQYRLQHKAGGYRWVEDHNRVLRDEAGQPIQVVGIWTDITEKRELEEKFLRSQRMENIGALAGGIAHDLNNALAPILMGAECLMLGCTPEQKRMLEIIYESARRSAEMVKQVTAFARGSEGRRGVVQLAHLVKDMAEIARHTFPKSIEVHTQIAPRTWIIRANPTELHQILLNLAVNARDAMPRGGALTLATANVHLDQASCAISPEARPGPFVLLTVTDTGTGMPADVQKRVFDPFFTTKAPGKGTGLGLSTVHNIVGEYGGFLTLKSEVGHGTEFGVYLPAEPEAAASATESAPPSRPVGKGQSIMLVDDEATIRNMAGQTLQNYGYKVIPAIDGARGIALSVQYLAELQLVIADLDMPEIDGLTMVRAIRTFAPRMKFIIASGSSSRYDSNALTDLNIISFLHKPYSADDLLRAVNEALHETKP